MPLMRLLAAWTILAISVATCLAKPPHGDLYVAPNGKDRQPGHGRIALGQHRPRAANCSARGWQPG